MRRFVRITILSAAAFAAVALATPAAEAQGPAVNHVVAIARPPVYSGPCPAQIVFSGTIVLNYPAQVFFRWERSDGATGPVQSFVIRSPGGDVFHTTWQLAAPPGQVFTGWERLHVLSPGDASSNPAGFRLICR